MAFIRSRLFIGIVVILTFIAFTYKVYDVGYNTAVNKLSLKAFEENERYNKDLRRLEENFSKLEREYLIKEAEKQKEFDRKYQIATKEINRYVKDNGFTDCSIGNDGVQRINELLKGSTTNN